ncbi:hypothetical protein B0T20DRAFT_404598 [Sordaria brevicollis]|uniref:Uncharacterized protein n=1 Tax=Sordaria brevicollis TaxID=83679 RepID=A0AAE0UEJ9_SORBR|nr:hypothetical protein B0T20DRAFT_404598 [Sordaria brevicollis]
MSGTKGSALRGVQATGRRLATTTSTWFCQHLPVSAWSSVCSSSISPTSRRQSTAAAAAAAATPAGAGPDAENVLPTGPGSTDPARPAPSLDASTTSDDDLSTLLWHSSPEALRRRKRHDEPPVSGIQTPFAAKFTPYSPSKVLASFIRRKGRRFPREKWHVLRSFASNRYPRLPGSLGQFMFKQRIAHLRRTGRSFYNISGLERYLETEHEWDWRIKRLENKGYSTSDLAEWSWILQGETGDEIVKRFVSRDTFKPFFLMNMVLGRDKRIYEAHSLAAIFDYISRHYLEPRKKPEEERVGPELRDDAFQVMMNRLRQHCAAIWPAALISVAHLVAAYIETCRGGVGGYDEQKWQRIRNRVFNSAICGLSKRSPINPYMNVRHNWEAQKVLLTTSVTMRPHLLITQNGYRSIRRVLLGLKKTAEERKATIRSAKTWPPYRLAWDGVDEKRDRQEDLSRSAKAGIMMIENGTDGPPKSSSSHMNVNAIWIAAIRATRNVREAWIEFQRPPRPNLRPIADVYAAMLEKLYAAEVPPGSQLLPGDSPYFVFPVHDGNLSAYEISRLTPPSPEDLYQQMRDGNIRPSDRVLEVMLKNANSLEAGLQYIKDGMYSAGARKALVGWSENVEQICTLPTRVFNAWIKLLCKTHSNYISPDPHSFSHNHIPLAIKLARLYQKGNARAAHKDKRPWHIILSALATDKFIMLKEGEQPHLNTLKVFMHVFERTIERKGLDIVMFDLLSRMVRKSTTTLAFETRKAVATRTTTEQNGDPRMVPVIRSAAEKLHATFKEITRPVVSSDSSARFELPTLQYSLTAPHILRYMQALGCLGNARLMLNLVNWVIDSWTDPRILETAREPGETEHEVLNLAFAYFIEMWPHLPVDEELKNMLKWTRNKLAALRHTQGCTWYLPPDGTEDRDRDLKGTDAVVAQRWISRQLSDAPRLKCKSEMFRKVYNEPRSEGGGADTSTGRGIQDPEVEMSDDDDVLGDELRRRRV